MIQFPIKHRLTGEVIFTAEIDCTEDAPLSLKLGLSVKWGVKNRADLTWADLTRADLTEADLTRADLTWADLTRADLTWANLTRADLTEADLTRADLTEADLTEADLTRANLTWADLTEADLTEADLTRADLTRANLTEADLTRANLTRADLTEANLTWANLTRANLTRADLTEANLTRANLTEADLTEADLTRATNSFKTDFIAEVLKLSNELEALRQTIIDGKIDGSTYSGECACLAGTLAKQCGTETGKDIPVNGFQFIADSSSPRERWFMMIKPGHTPENNRAAKEALAWLDEAISIRDHIRKIAA